MIFFMIKILRINKYRKIQQKYCFKKVEILMIIKKPKNWLVPIFGFAILRNKC